MDQHRTYVDRIGNPEGFRARCICGWSGAQEHRISRAVRYARAKADAILTADEEAERHEDEMKAGEN